MILFYVDESGISLGTKESPFFVLVATAISIEHWKETDNRFTELKRQIASWAKPEDFEIKGRDLRRGDNFFKNFDWDARAKAIYNTATLIIDAKCTFFAVQVEKALLPDHISNEDMYRMALYRLLDEIQSYLESGDQWGMMLFDSRSDLRSSIQDRRLIDAYRGWLSNRKGVTHLIELPWFGVSAFYAGLQIADFVAYFVDFVHNESHNDRVNRDVKEAIELLLPAIRLIRIP
jgi:hypothetical protein